jgi:hypothetical protein
LWYLGGLVGTGVVELSLPDGTPVLVRAELVQEAEWRSADGADYEGPGDAGFGGPSDVGIGGYSFDLVTKTVRGVTGELHKALQAVSPDRVSVEIGFDLALRGSHLVALVVSGGVHAALKIRLEWGSESAGNSDDERSEDEAIASS